MAGISSEGSDMRPEGQGIRSHRTGRYLVKRASFVSVGLGIESEGPGIRPQLAEYMVSRAGIGSEWNGQIPVPR